MFFDMIILNPQHRGHFSHAWLAATRGVKFISKETIRGIDISVLCNQLANFITTSSKDPKKRFSLRLSAILLNGTVKIYKEKVLLLQGQVVSALQIIHIPSGSKVRLTSVHREELFETPPTPVVKVKTKRGKKQVVETPTAVASIPEIGFREGELQLPEVEGFIPQATSDLISLREEAPRRTEEHVLEEEGFGVLTGKELEMEIDSLFPRVRAEPVAPLTSSSPSTPAQVMEVVALVHAGRGEFLEKVPEVDDVPRVPEMEIERVLEIEASEQQPIPMEIAEPEVPAIAAIEKHLPAAEITSTAVPPTEEAPIVSANLKKVGVPEERLVLREIQSLAEPVEELREKIAKVREPRKKAEDARKKAGRVIDKLFLRNKRKGFVRINRCNENEGRFVDQSYRLPIEFRNVHNDTLYNIFWFEEEVDGVRDEVRAGSSVRSTSLRTSIALARTPSRLTRSTLDKDLTDSLRRPLSEIETPQKEMPSLGLGEVLIGSEERPRQLPIQEPPVPVRPPSREKMSILDQEPLAVTIGEEPPMVQPSVPEFPLEGVVPTEEFPVPLETVPTVREELSQLQEEIIPSVQEVPPPSEKLLTPTAEKKETPRIPKSPSSDYKLRQQKIVECIKKWNFNERFPTIEDICEKPMTKMNMARAFSDLLILSAKKYIILCTEGESTELKYIKKGPRLE